MSQENVEIVRRATDAWNRGELDPEEAYHPDVEFLPLRAATEGGYHGLSGIEAFVSDTFEVFDKFDDELRVHRSRRVGARLGHHPCASERQRLGDGHPNRRPRRVPGREGSCAGRTLGRKTKPSKPPGWE